MIQTNHEGATMLTDTIATRQEHGRRSITRDEAIKAIRAALKQRSGQTWSVRGGRGTAYGWITIEAPKARRTARWASAPDKYGIERVYCERDACPAGDAYMTDTDCDTLAELLDINGVGHQGVSIPDSYDYYAEYVARAEGRAPSAIGTPYWD